jgi:CheY-like chemotaxis protein
MSARQLTLLVVDDEPFNLEIIAEYLEQCDYRLLTAGNGRQALEILQDATHAIDAVLLDRMMPGIDGIEVLRRIKQDAELRLLPVIMQTAASAPEQVAEGLREGAFYYLTKPFAPEVLRAVVATALRDRAEQKILRHDITTQRQALQLLSHAEFQFRTTDEAREIVTILSELSPSTRQATSMGLMELMLNAIEHGNLGITYDEKTALIREDCLQKEIQHRLELPENAGKFASIKFRRDGISLIFVISDQGNGFDWKSYLEMGMERLMDNHGRGIAMSRSISFTQLEYRGKGNIVEATIIRH